MSNPDQSTWPAHARRLADEIAPDGSTWRDTILTVPRHQFVPRWWTAKPDGGWRLRDGAQDVPAWMAAAYADRTLVTQVGPSHADRVQPDTTVTGRPTSSATLPGLILQMFRHLRVNGATAVLDIGTGSGYGCAVLARRLGDRRVSSIDVDPYLIDAARTRLDTIGLYPTLDVCDATGNLPNDASYDRIVATVSVSPIPPDWLTALRPGGRLVTVLAGTSLILTANKTDDGGAVGEVARDWAMFMRTRTGPDYPGRLGNLAAMRDIDGEEASHSPYPIPDIRESWELSTMLEVTAPGIEHHFEEVDGQRTALMLHPDGSWARATAHGNGPAIVHQSGPRRLWKLLDQIRLDWLRDGHYPFHGARVQIDPDGTVHLRRGQWTATVG